MDCKRARNLTEDGILPKWGIIIFYKEGDSVAWKLRVLTVVWCLNPCCGTQVGLGKSLKVMSHLLIKDKDNHINP